LWNQVELAKRKREEHQRDSDQDRPIRGSNALSVPIQAPLIPSPRSANSPTQQIEAPIAASTPAVIAILGVGESMSDSKD